MKSEEKDKVSEPSPFYNTTVKIFHSFKEAEESEIDTILQQEPMERIRETVELIRRIYKDDLRKPPRKTALNYILH